MGRWRGGQRTHPSEWRSEVRILSSPFLFVAIKSYPCTIGASGISNTRTGIETTLGSLIFSIRGYSPQSRERLSQDTSTSYTGLELPSAIHRSLGNGHKLGWLVLYIVLQILSDPWLPFANTFIVGFLSFGIVSQYKNQGSGASCALHRLDYFRISISGRFVVIQSRDCV